MDKKSYVAKYDAPGSAAAVVTSPALSHVMLLSSCIVDSRRIANRRLLMTMISSESGMTTSPRLITTLGRTAG
jgi:hypothetical protein